MHFWTFRPVDNLVQPINMDSSSLDAPAELENIVRESSGIYTPSENPGDL